MKFKDFEDAISGVNRISSVKIRDSWSPIPRGYSISGRDGYYLLISADGAVILYFDDFVSLIEDESVMLLFHGLEVGAVGLKDMEVKE